MKKIKLIASMVALALTTTIFAQNTTNKWYVGLGIHATDHTSVDGVFDNYFDTRDYSFSFPFSKLTVARSIGKNFAVDLQASAGNIDNKRLAIKDEFFLLAGLGVRYMPLSETNSWFDPYVRVGANYHKYDYKGINIDENNPYVSYDKKYKETEILTGKFKGKNDNFVVNGGVGINFWVTKRFGLNIESQYNWVTTYSRNYADFFQHSASLIFKFGNNDRDRDGIPDKDDLCPDVPGLAQFQGCPDTDGDGIPDQDDLCPNEAGPIENQGCPWGDRDNDGVLDKDDLCPDVAGLAKFQGCPDTDGDGIPDKDDLCPNEKGLAKFQGCPDTDGDGIPDKDDACPNEKGPKSNNGCPVKKETIDVVLKDINFEFNSAKITTDTSSKIDQAVELLKDSDLLANGAYIDGHTDRVGSQQYNLTLSKKRAQSVVDALVKSGVEKGKLTARGFGKAQLKCTEADVKDGTYTQAECDLANRRVEILPKDIKVKVTKPAAKKPAAKKTTTKKK